MSRAARLQSARHWLARHAGKDVVRSYAKWFGVDHLCAVKELCMLGIDVDPAYVAKLEVTYRERARRHTPKGSSCGGRNTCTDGHAGRNTAGFPSRVTWEELDPPGAFEDVLPADDTDSQAPF
jgi:hypothetical protein